MNSSDSHFSQIKDGHGQPIVDAFCQRMVTERQVDELIGMCKGILADGVLNAEEAQFLADWLETNRSGYNRILCMTA